MKSSSIKTLKALLVLLGVFVLVSCTRSSSPLGPDLPAVRLTVRVVNAMTSQGVPGARVSLKKDNQNVGNDAATDGNGSVTFEGVPGGEGYKAFAGSVPGFSPGASPSIKLEQDAEVVISLSPSVNQGAALVAGSVKDARTQAALPGVTVTLNPLLGTQFFGVRQLGGLTAQTDLSGQFTFNAVNPGSYQALFQLTGYPDTVRDVFVKTGEITTIETVFMSDGQGSNNSNNSATKGHVLIVESGRAVQLDPQGQIVWNYPSAGISCATRMPDGSTLIANEQNNQVAVIGPGGERVWEMGSTLGLFSKLKAPGWVSAARDGQSFLITDTGNNRVIEITGGQVSWENKGLNLPRAASYAPNGNILIADTGNRRVIEVDRQGAVVWSFDREMLAPVHAVRQDDGSTIITDAGYGRVIMIDASGNPFWNFDGGVSDGAPPESGLNRPRSTIPTAYGTFLISDTSNNRVIEVDFSRQVVNSIPNLARPLVIERL